MCGGKSQTTQQTTIPPEVLARYNAVNARAEDVAQQPFQRYGGEFVAPINEQQRVGIGGINQAANMAQGQMGNAQQVLNQSYQTAQPYLQQALGTAGGAYGQAQNQLGQAQGYLTNAASQGQIYGSQAYTPIAGALGAANPYMQTATQMVGGGLGAAAPMMGAAEGYLGGGTQAVNAQEFGQAQINKYMSPYMRNVVEAQQALQQQESAAQRSALNSQAIGAGAFGGDRAGIAQANLARQQSLANQATLGNLLQQGYGQAAGMFQQQQGVNLAAQQANRAAQQFGSQQAANLAQQRYAQQMGVGQQMAALGQQQFGQNIAAGQALSGLGQQMYQQGLGASQAAQGLGQATYGMGAQQGAFQQGIGSALYGMGTQQAMNQAALAQQQQAALLQGSQAQIGAGTLEQQTNQAQKTAEYNEFLQERGYPFQIAQFLANIAMGTGALSGSTTTTTQPNAWASDRRLKKDIKEIGETHDGLPIYSFKYKGGDDQQRIGVMADEAREKHPDAVQRVGGVDAVDYEKIANRASEGGGVMPHRAGEGFAEGGHVSPEDLSAIIAMQKQFLGPHGQGGLYGQSAQNLPGQKGIVPQASLPVSRLSRHAAPPQQQSGMQQVMSGLGQTERLGETLLGDKGLVAKGKQAYNYITGKEEEQKGNSAVNKGQTGASKTASNQPPAGSAKPMVQDYSRPKTTEAAPPVGGVKPGATELAMKDAITPPDEDIFVPSTYSARGGVVPHKAGGGHLQEKVLPYQAEDPYGLEAINEAESGEDYKLLGEDESKRGGGGGKSGKSGVSMALKGASALANLIPGAGPFISAGLGAASAFVKDGGRIRPAFQKGGDAEKKNSLVEYRDYMIEKGLEPHVAAGIAGNIAKESNGKPNIWGDNDNSFGLFQKNIRGELPAYQKWAQENQRNMYDPKAQIDHVIERLNGPYAKVYQQMRESNDPAQAAYQFAIGYERPVPATARYDERMKIAAQLAGGEYTGKGVAPQGEPRRQVAGAESTVDESGRRTEYVDGKPVSSGIKPPDNYRTGKPYESWGDFLTSRQFLVPLLSGVGAAASSPNRYAAGAILQGLGAAAQSYAGMEKPITEGEERRGLAATAAETAKKVAEEAKTVTGTLYEKKWIAGMGWFVYDKTKPYEPPVQITDKDLRPIGQKSVDIDKIPTAKDSASPGPVSKGAGTPGAAPASTGLQKAPTSTTTEPSGAPSTTTPTGAPTGKNALQALGWKAATEMPQGYVPPNQFNIEMDEDSKRREQSIAGPMIREQRSRANAANKELYRLDEMTGAFNTLPPNGLLTSGKYAPERLNFVKSLNTFSQVAGGKPFWDATQVGAAEQLAKDAFRLGQSAANSAGTVAGRDIIEQSVMATPGMELTAAGFRRVAAGMRAAAQYEIDKANFLDNYSGQWGHLSGAEELFNKMNPPEEYARKAVISTIDPALLKRVNAYVDQYKDRPIADIVKKLSPSIDRLYGTGVTAKILGAK